MLLLLLLLLLLPLLLLPRLSLLLSLMRPFCCRLFWC